MEYLIYNNNYIKLYNGRSNCKEYITYSYNNSGSYCSKLYYLNGLKHKTDGPAFIINDTSYSVIQWFVNGVRHRSNGPAYIFYSMPCNNYEMYYLEKAMKCKGTLNILYCENKVYVQDYYIDGKYITIM